MPLRIAALLFLLVFGWQNPAPANHPSAEPGLCTEVRPGEPPEDFAARLAAALVSETADGSRRVVKWPEPGPINLRHMSGDHYRLAPEGPHPITALTEEVLTGLANSVGITVHPSDAVPIGQANTRLIDDARSMSGVTYLAIEKTGKDPGRREALESQKRFKFHDYPLVRRTGSFGWTDCAAFVAYDGQWAIKGAGLSVLTHWVNGYWIRNDRDLRLFLEWRHRHERSGHERSGHDRSPAVRLVGWGRLDPRLSSFSLSNEEEVRQCIQVGTTWILGAMSDRGADLAPETAARLLYSPRLRSGDLEPVVRATISRWAEEEGCF